jgi:acetoin utilization protein AcuB
MDTHITDLMKSRVVTVEMDDSLSLAQSLMENASIHHLPVIDSQRRVVGMLSDRNLLRAISPFMNTAAETNRDLTIMRKPVHQIMSHHPITVSADCLLGATAQSMLDNNISALPVTEDDDRLIGIITWKDFIRHYITQNLTAQA